MALKECWWAGGGGGEEEGWRTPQRWDWKDHQPLIEMSWPGEVRWVAAAEGGGAHHLNKIIFLPIVSLEIKGQRRWLIQIDNIDQLEEEESKEEEKEEGNLLWHAQGR
jgi:hypothetical protein